MPKKVTSACSLGPNKGDMLKVTINQKMRTQEDISSSNVKFHENYRTKLNKAWTEKVFPFNIQKEIQRNIS